MPGIDGSKPTTIVSTTRALSICEFEARKAGIRGDWESENNLRALVYFLANHCFDSEKDISEAKKCQR